MNKQQYDSTKFAAVDRRYTTDLGTCHDRFDPLESVRAETRRLLEEQRKQYEEKLEELRKTLILTYTQQAIQINDMQRATHLQYEQKFEHIEELRKNQHSHHAMTLNTMQRDHVRDHEQAMDCIEQLTNTVTAICSSMMNISEANAVLFE